MNKFKIFSILLAFLQITTAIQAQEISANFGLEKTRHNWSMPGWALYDRDYCSQKDDLNAKILRVHRKTIELSVNFTGDDWSAGIIENEGSFDLSGHHTLSCEIYIPETAPNWLEARFVLIGPNNEWTEMKTPAVLKPGEWIKLNAKIDLKGHSWETKNNLKYLTKSFLSDVNKICIRIESDKIRFFGPVYIQNIKWE